MEDLPAEVQGVHIDLVFPLPTCRSDPLVTEGEAERRHVPGSLVAVVLLQGAVKDPEEVVVRASDDFTGGSNGDGAVVGSRFSKS